MSFGESVFNRCSRRRRRRSFVFVAPSSRVASTLIPRTGNVVN